MFNKHLKIRRYVELLMSPHINLNIIQLDGQALSSCPPGFLILKNLTVNRDHVFLLNVTTSNGDTNSSAYSWFIGENLCRSQLRNRNETLLAEIFVNLIADTIPPTATIVCEQNYTNAKQISIDIVFNEACNGHGGFKCETSSDCDVSEFKITFW